MMVEARPFRPSDLEKLNELVNQLASELEDDGHGIEAVLLMVAFQKAMRAIRRRMDDGEDGSILPPADAALFGALVTNDREAVLRLITPGPRFDA
jgi:hypothetical protein